ncbi:MAG: hypothetical protein QHH80_05690, partial [Anaerolineae bacterium]|nr:hypothetical protein [Anaerolineae bacterium]
MPLSDLQEPAGVQPHEPDPGAIWTTLEACNKADAQNVNQYFIGDPIYVRGNGMGPNETLPWAITGTPGSCDPNVVVASGFVTADANGDFCFQMPGGAYVVNIDDCGVYKYNVGRKNDNYSVKGATFRLDLTKTGPASVCYSDSSQQVTYTYVVTNNSSSTITLYNVMINDDLAGPINTGDTDLAPGASATFTKTYTIPGGTTAPVINRATATANTRNDNSGVVITSGQATWTINIIRPGLALSKTGPAQATVGQTITYSFRVTNTGNAPLSGVTVTDALLGLSYSVGSLPVGGSASFTHDYTVKVSDPDPLVNTATATGNASGCPASATAQWSVRVNRCTLEVTIAPTSAELNCNNNHSVLLTATPTGAHGAVTYQWYKNGTAITGATNSTYNATSAGEYWVIATDTGVPDCTDESNHAVVTYVPNPDVSVTPTSGELNCNVASVLLT